MIPPETSNIGGSWSALTKVRLFDFFTLTLIFGSLVFEIWYLLVMKLFGDWYLVFGNFHLSGLCSPWLGLEDFLTFTFVNDKYQVN